MEYYLVKTMKNNVKPEKHNKEQTKYGLIKKKSMMKMFNLQQSKDTKFIVALW